MGNKKKQPDRASGWTDEMLHDLAYLSSDLIMEDAHAMSNIRSYGNVTVMNDSIHRVQAIAILVAAQAISRGDPVEPLFECQVEGESQSPALDLAFQLLGWDSVGDEEGAEAESYTIFKDDYSIQQK